MQTLFIKIASKYFLYLLLAFGIIFSTNITNAASIVSPAGCNADRSKVDISRSTPTAEIGETVTFDVSISNDGPPEDGCDIINRTITVTLPDGSVHIIGPSDYVFGTPYTVVGSFNYVTQKNDIISGKWTTYISWTGTQLDGSETPSTGTKGSSINYIPVSFEVSKNVNPSYTETFDWDIEKTVTPDSHELFDGQLGTSDYEITVTKSGPVLSDFEVSGTITIYNPAKYATGTITGVSDALDDGTVASVDCGVSFPYDLAPDDTLECSYTALPIDDSSTFNTATVEASGDVLGGEGTADVDWSNADITTVNGEVNVTDTMIGGLGSTDVTHTFIYSRDFDCRDIDYAGGTHGQFIYPNTATIIETKESDDASVTVDCYIPTVEKTANPSIEEGYTWTIDKSVTPETWNLFVGDSGVSEYTISVEKTLSDTDYSVDGGIIVTNTSLSLALTINSVDDLISGLGPIGVDCGILPRTLLPGESLNCTYDTVLPNGDTRINTATANFSDDVTSVSGDAEINFVSVTPNVTGGEINVDDTFDEGDKGPITDSTTYTYSKKFVCGGAGGYEGLDNVIGNTATILENGNNDSASVEVNCYDLDVTKTADTTFDRTYDWTIEKVGDISSLTLGEGEIGTINYDVTVSTTGYIDDNFAVSGLIHIVNNNPSKDADLTQVLDNLSIDGSVSVDCPSLTVPSGSTLDCTYETNLTGGDDQLNIATITQQNYEYGIDYIAVLGTTDYSGNASVTFGAPTNEFDTSVEVNDTIGGYLGTATIVESPKTFSYSYDVSYEGEGACGLHEVPNIADFITNDNGITGDDNWLVNVDVLCELGCTYTQGYWKNHSAAGPAPYDETWTELGDFDTDGSEEEHLEDLYDGGTWLKVFNTAPKGGNVWYQLAHQWMAAYLNMLSGASTDSLGTSLDEARDWLENNDPSKKIKGKDASEAKNWATLFDNYNNGIIGPGHCE